MFVKKIDVMGKKKVVKGGYVQVVERSAKTGRFVKKGTEKRRPSSTVLEKIRRQVVKKRRG